MLSLIVAVTIMMYIVKALYRMDEPGAALPPPSAIAGVTSDERGGGALAALGVHIV